MVIITSSYMVLIEFLKSVTYVFCRVSAFGRNGSRFAQWFSSYLIMDPLCPWVCAEAKTYRYEDLLYTECPRNGFSDRVGSDLAGALPPAPPSSWLCTLLLSCTL